MDRNGKLLAYLGSETISGAQATTNFISIRYRTGCIIAPELALLGFHRAGVAVVTGLSEFRFDDRQTYPVCVQVYVLVQYTTCNIDILWYVPRYLRCTTVISSRKYRV